MNNSQRLARETVHNGLGVRTGQPWDVAVNVPFPSQQDIGAYDETPVDLRHTLLINPTAGALHVDIYGTIDSQLNLACREVLETQVMTVVAAQPETYLTRFRVDHPAFLIKEYLSRTLRDLKKLLKELGIHLAKVQDIRGGEVLDTDIVADSSGVLAAMQEQYHGSHRGSSRKPWVCILYSLDYASTDESLCAYLEIPHSLSQFIHSHC